jgi:hypothetical protein
VGCKAWGSLTSRGKRFSCFLKHPNQLPGHLALYAVGTRVLSWELGAGAFEVDQSSPSRGKVEEELSYTSASSYASWFEQGQLYSTCYCTLSKLRISVYHL